MVLLWKCHNSQHHLVLFFGKIKKRISRKIIYRSIRLAILGDPFTSKLYHSRHVCEYVYDVVLWLLRQLVLPNTSVRTITISTDNDRDINHRQTSCRLLALDNVFLLFFIKCGHIVCQPSNWDLYSEMQSQEILHEKITNVTNI